MTHRMTLLASAAALAFTFGATSASADTWYEDWDSDGDGMLNQSEWSTGLAENDTYSAFDANDDGMLDEDEWGEDLVDLDGSIDDTFDMDEDSFAEATYSAFDANEDGLLDENELATVENQFGTYDAI